MENLSVMWEKLSLPKEKGNEYNVKAVETIRGKLIATKFFTRRVLNIEAIAQTFKPLWQTKKRFDVKDMLGIYQQFTDVIKQ